MTYSICPASDVVTQGYGCTSILSEWINASCPTPHRFHSGIDLGITIGSLFHQPVYATGPGVVVAIGNSGATDALFATYLGNQAVCVRESDGIYLIYGHLDQANVTRGQTLKTGDLIGVVGSRGLSTGPHVHIEARKDGPCQQGYAPTINPSPYLNGGHMFDSNDRATLIKLTVAAAAAGLGVVLTDAELDTERVKVHDNLDNLQSVLAEIKANHPTPASGGPTSGTIQGTITLK